MVKKLKYKVIDDHNHTVHYSYTKKKAEEWIKKFGNKNISYTIKKMDDFTTLNLILIV